MHQLQRLCIYLQIKRNIYRICQHMNLVGFSCVYKREPGLERFIPAVPLAWGQSILFWRSLEAVDTVFFSKQSCSKQVTRLPLLPRLLLPLLPLQVLVVMAERVGTQDTEMPLIVKATRQQNKPSKLHKRTLIGDSLSWIEAVASLISPNGLTLLLVKIGFTNTFCSTCWSDEVQWFYSRHT